MQAEGVIYFKYEGTPADYFRCEPYRVKLSTNACARNCNAVLHTTGDDVQLGKCRACASGAAHGGKTAVHYSLHSGKAVCPRCRNSAGRMIGARRWTDYCNCEREFTEAINANGTKPACRDAMIAE